MASFDDVVQARNKAYDDIWDIAQGALSTLKSSSFNYSYANMETLAGLRFDPGVPGEIKFLAGAVDPSSIIDKIDSYIQQLDKIQAPQFPNSTVFQMEDHQMWSDPFFDQIKSSLSSYISSMGIPDASYSNAIFNEEYERNLQTLNDMLDLADAKTGARGFSYPNDFGIALKIEAMSKYQFDKTQLSRTISKTIVEWARQNFQFATEKGIALEQASMDFTYKYCTAFVSIYKEMVHALLEKYKAQVEVVIAPIQALKEELSVAYEYSKINAEIGKTNETLKQSRSELQIREALGKYQSDSSLVTAEFSQQMEQIRSAAQHSAGLAQATTASVIGLSKA